MRRLRGRRVPLTVRISLTVALLAGGVFVATLRPPPSAAQLPSPPSVAIGVPVGAAGSTWGDPPPQPDSIIAEARLILAPGTTNALLVSGFLDGETIRCEQSTTTCTVTYGLYVDGVPVPGTQIPPLSSPAGSNSGYDSTLDAWRTGRSAVLGPGLHVVTLARKVLSGTPTFEPESYAGGSVSAIAVTDP